MLDFVPNHTALDHPWVDDHPEYYVAGTEANLAREPHNYAWVKRTKGDLLLAHGRDPYFPGWPDTLQLDYSNPAAHEPVDVALGSRESNRDFSDGHRAKGADFRFLSQWASF